MKQTKDFCHLSSLFLGKVDLCEDDTKRYGFASSRTLQCSLCNAQSEFYSSTRKSSKSAFAINERASLAFRLFGGGNAALSKFAEVMDMPKPVDCQCVKQHIVSALAAAEKEAERSMKEAAAALRAVAQPEPTPPGIEMSFDGSWSQRGFTAAYG